MFAVSRVIRLRWACFRIKTPVNKEKFMTKVTTKVFFIVNIQIFFFLKEKPFVCFVHLNISKWPQYVVFQSTKAQRVTWSLFQIQVLTSRRDTVWQSWGINVGLTTSHYVRRYWSKFRLIPLIKGKNNTVQIHDLKERLDERLNQRFWPCDSTLRLWFMKGRRNVWLIDSLIEAWRAKARQRTHFLRWMCAWWEVRLTCR